MYQIIRLWFPLALNFQLMAMEGPFLTTLIARLEGPEKNLAAFAVMFAWALIIESPVIPLLGLSSALVKDSRSLKVLERFMWHMIFISFILQTIFVLPPVFHIFAYKLLDMPADIAELIHQGSVVMLLWSPAIGYRRFFQGIMLREGYQQRVGFSTLIRVFGMIAGGSAAYYSGHAPGCIVAATGLVSGVVIESIAVRIMAQPAVNLVKRRIQSDNVATYSEVATFYTPLALSVFIGLASQPVTTFALGHSALGLESLAAMPIANSIIYNVLCSVLALQEVAIVRLSQVPQDRKKLLCFAVLLGSVLSMALILFNTFGVVAWWLTEVTSLPIHLHGLCATGILFGILQPLLRAIEYYLRGSFISCGSTKVVSLVSLAELIILTLGLTILTQWFSVPGLYAAVLSVAISSLGAISLFVAFSPDAKK